MGGRSLDPDAADMRDHRPRRDFTRPAISLAGASLLASWPLGRGRRGQPFPDLRTFIHSALTLRTGLGGWASRRLFFRTKTGCDVRFLKRGGSAFKLPTLRFRAKIMLGFAVVLAISAASMGFAYLGFERVSDGVDSYRRSVQEADLSRDIDRELISYRSLARYFVATGKEEDGKAALAAEASLKDAIAPR